MMDVIISIAHESFILLAQMSPYLILGIISAGALHILLPVGTVAKHLGKRGIGSVIKAAILGVPLPICSCGVVPVAAALKKDGASNGAVVSFLITTPTTGVDSILATYSLLGSGITFLRVAASLFIGIFAGGATNVLDKNKTRSSMDKVTLKNISKDISCVKIEKKESPLLKGIKYSFLELLGGLSKPMLLGVLLGGLVAVFLPDAFLKQYIGNGCTGYLAMLALGVPLYVCASGSIPLAAALILKGISPGAALIFLIAGPATNIASITVMSKILGKRVLLIYLAVLILGVLVAGFVTDYLFYLFPYIFSSILLQTKHSAHGISLFEIISGAVLGLLMVYHILKATFSNFKKNKTNIDSTHITNFSAQNTSCSHCANTVDSVDTIEIKSTGCDSLKNTYAKGTTTKASIIKK